MRIYIENKDAVVTSASLFLRMFYYMIDYTRILELLVSLMGILMGFANVPQALKIYRTRSAKDVSGSTYVILLIGNIVLFVYAVSLGQKPLIVTSVATIIGVSLVLSGIVRYEKKGSRHRGI